MWGRASKNGGNRKLLSEDQNVLAISEKYVSDCIRMCSELGGKEMNICLFADDIADFDKTHGTIAAERINQILRRVLPMLGKLCKEAKDHGLKLALEPLNRYSTPYCASAADALAVAKQVDNLGILLDPFHMNIEEDSFEDAILAFRKHLLHTHFADNNRRMSGFAHIDFKTIVTSLQKIGYNGYVSFEPNIADRNYEYAPKKGLEFVKQIEATSRSAAASKVST